MLGAVAWSAGLAPAPVLLTMAICFGVASGLTMPAGMTLLRQIVAGEDLGTVQGWNQVSSRTMKLLGAPAGGVLVAWRGPVGVMVLDAVTFLAIAVVLTLVVHPRYRLPRALHDSWRDTFTEGLVYLRDHDTAKLFVIGLTALNVFVTPVTGLGVALRVSSSGWGAHWLGFADAALAAGAIIGSLVAIRWQPTYGAAAGFRVLVLQGLAIAAVGIGWQPVLLVSMAVLGFTAGSASVWLSAAFIRAIDPAHLGRVSSVTSLGDMTLMPLSVPALGAARRGDEHPHRDGDLWPVDGAALPVVRHPPRRSARSLRDRPHLLDADPEPVLRSSVTLPAPGRPSVPPGTTKQAPHQGDHPERQRDRLGGDHPPDTKASEHHDQHPAHPRELRRLAHPRRRRDRPA